MKKYAFLDTNFILSINVMCTSVVFALFLNASLVQYPTMMRNKEDWSTSLERTFVAFIIFPVTELLTDIYLVYKLRHEDFEFYLRLVALCILLFGWLVSLAFVVPMQLELTDAWSVMTLNSLLTWGWVRTTIWGIRFTMVAFDVVCEVREEQSTTLPHGYKQSVPNGYKHSVKESHDVFTFDDSDE